MRILRYSHSVLVEGVWLAVLVTVALCVPVCVPVFDCVELAVMVLVVLVVAELLGVPLGVMEDDCELEEVTVLVGVPELVAPTERVSEADALPEPVLLLVREADDVGVGEEVRLALGVPLCVAVWLAVCVGVPVCEGVPDCVPVREGVCVWLALGVPVCVVDGDAPADRLADDDVVDDGDDV